MPTIDYKIKNIEQSQEKYDTQELLFNEIKKYYDNLNPTKDMYNAIKSEWIPYNVSKSYKEYLNNNLMYKGEKIREFSITFIKYIDNSANFHREITPLELRLTNEEREILESYNLQSNLNEFIPEFIDISTVLEKIPYSFTVVILFYGSRMIQYYFQNITLNKYFENSFFYGKFMIEEISTNAEKFDYIEPEKLSPYTISQLGIDNLWKNLIIFSTTNYYFSNISDEKILGYSKDNSTEIFSVSDLSFKIEHKINDLLDLIEEFSYLIPFYDTYRIDFSKNWISTWNKKAKLQREIIDLIQKEL